MRRMAITSRWNDILRALSSFGKRGKADVSLRRRTFRFEPLEDRQLLSVCHWDGGGADNKWMTKENWVGDVAPVAGDSLYFEGTTRTATENDFANGTSFPELCFVSSTAFSVSGNSITLPDLGIISACDNSAAISANVAIGGFVRFQANDGCALTMSGVVSDSGSTPGVVCKFWGGVLTLAGANTFTGETDIEAGTLRIGNDAAIQNSSDVYVGNDSTFDLNGHSVAADYLYCSESGKITSSVSGDVTLSIRTSTVADSECVGVIEDGLGRLSLVKVGTDTLFLGGANTYTGGTTIAGGKIVINSDSALGQANGSGTFGDLRVNSGTTLDLNGHDVTVHCLRNDGSQGGMVTDLGNGEAGTSMVFVQDTDVRFAGTFGSGTVRQAAPARVTAKDFYVAPDDPNDPPVGDGSDSNVGSWTQPWQTLHHVNAMTWSRNTGIPAGGIVPGDHVYFRGGSYEVLALENGIGNATWSLTHGGVEGYPITLAAYGSETVKWNVCYNRQWTYDTETDVWSTPLAGAPTLYGSYWSSYLVRAAIENNFPATSMYSTATVTGLPEAATYGAAYFARQSDAAHGVYYVQKIAYSEQPLYYLFWDGDQHWRIATTLDNNNSNYWSVGGTSSAPPANMDFTPHGTLTGSPRITVLDAPGDLPQDFLNPPAPATSSYIKFRNDDGQLIYDLIYCNPDTKVLYLKSNEVAPITDPNGDVYVGGGSAQLNVESSDFVFEGITFNWGFQLKLYGSRITIENCKFLDAKLYSPPYEGTVIANCYFDYLGGWESHFNGGYRTCWLGPYVYLDGANMSFHDNFIGRDRSGCAFGLWPDDSDNMQVYNNVIYQSQICVQNSGDNGEIYNNVMFSVPYQVRGVVEPKPYLNSNPVWYMCKGNSGQEFHNNYAEVADGFVIYGGDWAGYTQSGVAVDDNVFVEASNSTWLFVQTYPSVTYSSISDNTWIGNGTSHGAIMDSTFSTTNSQTFVNYLNQNHGTGNIFEEASQFLDVQATDTFLNTNPTLAEAMAYFRNYAARRSVTVSLDSLAPSSNDVLTATAKKLDIGNENNPDVTLTFVWKVNGIVKQTHVVSDPNVTDTFDLGVAGNGNVGDIITVELTPTVGGQAGETVTCSTGLVIDPNIATRVWTGAGANTNWSTAANWAGGVAPSSGDYLVFDDATVKTAVNDLSGLSIAGITILDTGYTLSGNSITLASDGGIKDVTTTVGANTLSIPITISNAASFTIAESRLLAVTAVVSGSGNLTVEGAGTLVLTNSATFTGDTTIAGAILRLNANATIAGDIINNGGLDINNSATVTLAGDISGSGVLSKSGVGTLVLIGTNTYTGVTSVDAGTLQVGLGAQLPILTGGGVDIQLGRVIFDYAGGSSPASAILAALTASYDAAGDARFDTGYFRSYAAETDYCGLAWKDNTGASQVMVVYALYGDANLDGSVDSADQAVVTAHLYQNGNWSEGDFNYDGIVDDLDAAICASNVGNTVDTALLDLYS